MGRRYREIYSGFVRADGPVKMCVAALRDDVFACFRPIVRLYPGLQTFLGRNISAVAPVRQPAAHPLHTERRRVGVRSQLSHYIVAIGIITKMNTGGANGLIAGVSGRRRGGGASGSVVFCVAHTHRLAYLPPIHTYRESDAS